MSDEQADKMSDARRSDGRYLATPRFIHYLLRQEPLLAFNPGFTREQFAAWQGKVREKLRELLTFPDPPEQPPPERVRVEQRDGYQLEHWELYPEPRCVVPMLMLVPDGVTERSAAPGVMCFPGSRQPKEALCGEPWDSDWVNRFGEHNYMAVHFVRAGLVALALDNPGTETLSDPLNRCYNRNSAHLIWLGRSYEGLSTFQKVVAFRWLRTLPFVDGGRVAACGHSLGALPALLLGVLEPDVAAVIWNDFVGSWRARDVLTNLSPIALWHYIPGFARWLDYTDLMAALAPMPFLATEGGRDDDHDRIRRAYEIAGAPDNVKFTFMPNFTDPAARSREPIPEGVAPEEFGRYANYDGDHYFKDEVAVPWLSGMLGG